MLFPHANMTSKYGPRTEHLADGGRMTGMYDRWPVALQYGNTASVVAEHLPQPIMARPAAPARVPQMFRGLDQYTSNRDRFSSTLSCVIHVVAAVAIVSLGMMIPTNVVKTADTNVAPIHFTLYDPPPPPVMQVAKAPGGGGGGGAHQVEAPTKGHVPTEAKPKVPMVRLEQARINLPKLSVEPTTQIRLPQDTALPQIGMAQSQQVTLASQGSGSNSGFGIGLGGGIGQGHGTGMGAGSNGSYGGLMNVGGGVSAPHVIHSVEPQFTPEARQANYQGVVAIQLIVDSQGNPQDVHVVRHLGMGLDERAIEAVKQYKFSPAIYQGHAVSVQMIIDVDFRLH